MDPHLIIDEGSVTEYKKFIKEGFTKSSSAKAVELYWYMLEIFTDMIPIGNQRNVGNLTVDEWMSLVKEEIYKKIS